MPEQGFESNNDGDQQINCNDYGAWPEFLQNPTDAAGNQGLGIEPHTNVAPQDGSSNVLENPFPNTSDMNNLFSDAFDLNNTSFMNVPNVDKPAQHGFHGPQGGISGPAQGQQANPPQFASPSDIFSAPNDRAAAPYGGFNGQALPGAMAAAEQLYPGPVYTQPTAMDPYGLPNHTFPQPVHEHNQQGQFLLTNAANPFFNMSAVGMNATPMYDEMGVYGASNNALGEFNRNNFSDGAGNLNYNANNPVSAVNDDPNIEYVSADGTLVKPANVQYDQRIGFFIPVTSRQRVVATKRKGPRPGSDEPLYDMCKWNRRDAKNEDSECLGINVYGDNFDIPPPWDLPNDLGRIRYDKDGCIPKTQLLTARQIRAYIDHNPRALMIRVANTPAQANHRMFADKCVWNCCPIPTRTIRQGFQQVVFDEYPAQTDNGERDPYRVSGRMHLFCYEQCSDIVEDFKRGIVRAEVRNLVREERNAMSLTRDKINIAVERETYDPWFRHHIQNSNGALMAPRPREETLGHALTMHHLQTQPGQRQNKRDMRNHQKAAPKTIDIHQGDLEAYAAREKLSDAWKKRCAGDPSYADDAFQPCRNPAPYTLQSYFGSKATGAGFLLDPSLKQSDPQPPRKQSGRKRSRSEAQADEDEDIYSCSDDNGGNKDERPGRAVKRPRTSRPSSSAGGSPGNRSTRANPQELVFPKFD